MFWLLCLAINAGAHPHSIYDTTIRPADTRPESYVPLLKGKRVGLIINQTSRVGDSSLLDILLSRGVQVTAIFVPEHGFRGSEDAGAHIENTVDSATHIPVISLYGSHKKPRPDDLKNIEVLVYDLQDVGVRFYTYISTLQYCMQACAQNDKQLIILDRPNPNGFYVDGPVLQKSCTSFVGMQPIPVVYGMTAGEYAQMLIGEKWIDSSAGLDIKVIQCENYTHKKKYKLPVSPSPNLRTMAAVYAYPSLCLFEGTAVSVGRGTDKPFEQYGCPDFAGKYTYSFTPLSGPGAKKPLYEGIACYGNSVGENESELLSKLHGEIDIHWLIAAYNNYPDQDKFFTSFFRLLSGTNVLSEQIKSHLPERDIRKSWQNDLQAFRKIRKKYLLYEDFEK
jgi:uncharacterized protein YbbC (DUF1343 family)